MAFDVSQPWQTFAADFGVENYADQMLRRKMAQGQIDQQTQQTQGLAAKAIADMRKQARQSEFEGALGELGTTGDSKSVAGLMARFPEYSEGLKRGHDALDEGEKQSQLSGLGQINHMITTGNMAGALAMAKQRRDADAKAGRPVDDDDQMIAALESKDPAIQKGAIGLVRFGLASLAGPEKFAEAYGKLNPSPDTKVVAPGSTVVTIDPLTGKPTETYSSPYKPEFIRGADGAIYQSNPGGGGQASSGGGAIPFDNLIRQESRGRQFGSDGKVTTSPKGALGIAQIMPGTAPEAAKLAGLPYDATRLRTDPDYNRALGEAYYNEQRRKFGRDDYAAAAYNAGPGRVEKAIRASQTTGRDWRTFLPAETRDYVAKVSGGRELDTGTPSLRTLVPGKAGPARMTPAEVAAEGLDSNVVYYRGADGVPQAVSGQTRQTQGALPKVPATTMKAFVDNRKSLSSIDRALKEVNAYPDAVGFVVGNTPNFISQRSDPKGVAARAAIADIGSLLIHDRSGAAVTISETPRLLPFVPQVSDDPATIRKKLANLRAALLTENQDMRDAYSNENGESQLDRIGPRRGQPAQQRGWGKAVRVK